MKFLQGFSITITMTFAITQFENIFKSIFQIVIKLNITTFTQFKQSYTGVSFLVSIYSKQHLRSHHLISHF